MKISDHFEDMLACWYPDGVSPAQRNELENVYFAGAAAVFVVLAPRLADGDELTEAEAAALDGMEAELRAAGCKSLFQLKAKGSA